MDKAKSTPIAVVAYNRPKSLERILKSIAKAHYPKIDVPLIISIDYAVDNDDVLQVANDFNWKYGKKTISYQERNLGLRKHVLKCGSLALEHGSVIVLEDDLFVAPSFYFYAIDALKFVDQKDYIGGVSLYNHQINVQTLANFSPIEDGFDNWYFQFASSWGQTWTKVQWQGFLDWYKTKPVLVPQPAIPEKVSSWSEKSWLKYYTSYLIEKNKYFLYPKISLSTNFNEVGTHNPEESTAFQVPLRFGIQSKFVFSKLEESNSVYDSFYENVKIYRSLNIESKDLCVSLNNYKPITKEKRFIITRKKMDFKIVNSFGCSLKPIDANIINNVLGNYIFLYDLKIKEKNNFTKSKYKFILYNIKILTYKNTFFLFYKMTFKKIGNLFKKIISIIK